MNVFLQFEDILTSYVKDRAIKELPIRWNENHRFYHVENHLISVIKNIELNSSFKYLNIYEKHALLLAAFFHDVIYDPKRQDNEDKSIQYFKWSFKNNDPKMVNVVKDLIECTKYRKRPLDKLKRILWEADNAGFIQGYDILLKTEQLIRKEYSHVPAKIYKEKRIEFLESNLGLFNSSTDKDLNKLIAYVEKKY